jgi:hypothetical protein
VTNLGSGSEDGQCAGEDKDGICEDEDNDGIGEDTMGEGEHEDGAGNDRCAGEDCDGNADKDVKGDAGVESQQFLFFLFSFHRCFVYRQ